MAYSKNTVKELISQYIAELGKNNIFVIRAILFGSYASGKETEYSDIDLALISEDFSGDRFKDRRRIVPLRRKICNDIEPVPFRPEDFENGGILIEEIKSKGEIIF